MKSEFLDVRAMTTHVPEQTEIYKDNQNAFREYFQFYSLPLSGVRRHNYSHLEMVNWSISIYLWY